MFSRTGPRAMNVPGVEWLDGTSNFYERGFFILFSYDESPVCLYSAYIEY